MAEKKKALRENARLRMEREVTLMENAIEDIDELEWEDVSDCYDAVVQTYEQATKAHMEYMEKVGEEAGAVEEAEWLKKVDDCFREARKGFKKAKKTTYSQNQKDHDQAKRRDLLGEFDNTAEILQREHGTVRVMLEAPGNDHDKREAIKVFESKKVSLGRLLADMAKLTLAGDSRDDLDERQTTLDRLENLWGGTMSVAVRVLKEPVTRGGMTGGATSGGMATSGGGSSTTIKREQIDLPKFSGEKSAKGRDPILEYPIWKTQWLELIKAYPVNVRATMLLGKTGQEAQLQFAGLENDYEEAMKRLEAFYGDSRRLIRVVLGDLMAQGPIRYSDFRSQVEFSCKMESHWARLKVMNLEKEMGNSVTMDNLLGKFPMDVRKEWVNHLETLDKTRVRTEGEFEYLIQWLKTKKDSWEKLASIAEREKPVEEKKVRSHYNQLEEGEEDKPVGKSCFGCKEEGHIVSQCPRRECFNCGQNGHYARECTKKKRDSRGAERRVFHKRFPCALCKEVDKSHTTAGCGKIRKMSATERGRVIEENLDCRRCLGDHPMDSPKCEIETNLCGSGKKGKGCGAVHKEHEMVCSKVTALLVPKVEVLVGGKKGSGGTFLHAMWVKAGKKGEWSRGFFDSGGTSDFVRHDYAQKKGFRGRKVLVNVETLGGRCEVRQTLLYECHVLDRDGKKEEFEAYGEDKIVSRFEEVSLEKICEWFPHLSQSEKEELARRPQEADFLLGNCHASWQPDKAELARGESDLFIMRSRFGIALGGRPKNGCGDVRGFCLDIKEVIGHVRVEEWGDREECSIVGGEIPQHVFVSRVNEEKRLAGEENEFLRMERMGTMVEPLCGSCKCGRCPVPGSIFSFNEQKQLDLINKLREYDEKRGCWVTEYPWKGRREELAKNEEMGWKVLRQIEKKLLDNPEWGACINDQIQDMIDREAAIELSKEEREAWEGHFHYLPFLAAVNPKKNTKIRICFDAARRQGGRPAMNDIVYKGPDKFINNLVRVLLGFRRGRLGGMSDITKFHNKVRLKLRDIHMQRFLWRFLKTDESPRHFAMAVNNMGVSPANAIATAAVRESADKFRKEKPKAAQVVRDQMYVDDLLPSFESPEEAEEVMGGVDMILTHADMMHKGWIVSGGEAEEQEMVVNKEDWEERTLGQTWKPKEDEFVYKVTLKLSGKNVKLSHDCPTISLEQLKKNPPERLTRRVVFSEFAKVFDPMGLVTPVLLGGKILMKEAWGKEVKFGWDEPLPQDQVAKWCQFLEDLFGLELLKFDRSLMPLEEVVGKPMLIVFSDGSKVAFGACAYIRWELKKGGYWCRLIMAKGKIVQKGMISIPRIELNGAVLGKRLKSLLMEHPGFDFEKAWNLIDSSTVLGYLTRQDRDFKPYEGVRVSEIQVESGEGKDGELQGWAWVAGEKNPADLCTRPQSPEKLGKGSLWQDGPAFIWEPESVWPIVKSFQKLDPDMIEEEEEGNDRELVGLMRVVEPVYGENEKEVLERILGLAIRYSSWKKYVRVVAWVLCFHKMLPIIRKIPKRNEISEFKVGGKIRKVEWTHRAGLDQVLPVLDGDILARAEKEILKAVQMEIWGELVMSVAGQWSPTREKVTIKGQYKSLAPVQGEDGLWRIGGRMRSHVPFTENNQMPIILPYDSPVTRLLMRNAHEVGHGGQDRTLLEFRRLGFWTVRGGRLAKAMSEQGRCVKCQKLEPSLMKEEMGLLPEEVLKEREAWGRVQLDLFGPMVVKSDVKARTTMKVWGIVVEDVASGAVYLDVLRDYSAGEVMVVLRRFGSIRGWPGVIQTDPGSQLESAGGKLTAWWEEASRSMEALAAREKFRWEISPADSPWRQGKAERRVGVVKRLIKLALGDAKVTPLDLQTILFEIADQCNNRPISVTGPREDGSWSVLTPNHLMKGRASGRMEDDKDVVAQLKNDTSSNRYRVICQVTENFWRRWAGEVAPGRVFQQKWFEAGEWSLGKGDVVLICEAGKIKSKYKIAVVDEVVVSRDGRRRSAVLSYVVGKSKEGDTADYPKPKFVTVSRSVQRLALLVSAPREEKSLVAVDEGGMAMFVRGEEEGDKLLLRDVQKMKKN